MIIFRQTALFSKISVHCILVREKKERKKASEKRRQREETEKKQNVKAYLFATPKGRQKKTETDINKKQNIDYFFFGGG